MRGVAPALSVSFTFTPFFLSRRLARLTFPALAASESGIDIWREGRGERERSEVEEGVEEMWRSGSKVKGVGG